MRKKTKAQSAVEYLIIIGFSFLVIIPVVYMLYGYTQESSGEMAEARLDKIGRELVANGASMYYAGEPSRVTIEANMPEGVLNMTTITNDPATGCEECTELRFAFQKGSAKQYAYFSSDIEIRGQNCTNPSADCDVPDYPKESFFGKEYYSQGLKKLVVEARSDHILIRR